MPRAPGTGQWDAEADKILLLTIIENGQLKSCEWPSIAAKMQQKGFTFSHEACRQHYQKIRKEFRGESTPSKPKAKAPTNSTPNPRKGSKASKSFTSELTSESDTAGSFAQGDDDEFGSPSPLKRKRTKAEGPENDLQSAPVFKMEEYGNSFVDLERDDLYYA